MNRKTAYDYCIENNIKVVGLENVPEREHEFYTKGYTHRYEGELKDFVDSLELYEGVEVTEGLHLKSEKYLELRMFTLVPYNIMGIQKGIQHEHSVTQFLVDHVIDADVPDERAMRWARSHKTVIVKNGGTSNEGHEVKHIEGHVWYEGTMQQAREKLRNMGINFSEFYEPDLNSMLTGLSLIADERVFDKRKYPDFDFETIIADPTRKLTDEEFMEQRYQKWVEDLGGEINVELRTFLFSYRLA